MSKSIFITLEGVDGAGKSTHIDFIKNYFDTKKINFYMTREPGGTDLGEKLRRSLLHENMDPLTETILMFAARCEHIKSIIKPKLESDITVVSDRFTDATYAYQHGGKGIDLQTIDILKKLIQKELEPDLTFLFDLPVNISIERLKKTREMDKFESENEAFHQAIRSTYLAIAKKNKDRFYILDSTQEIVAIQKEISDILDRFF
jgi:dTMP kinase